jgi:hypothetical protein
MYGHHRNSGISWMRDYGDALHKYESVEPIRGRVKEPMRPLGMRRSVDSYSIVKREDGAVECVLWKTPVVTWYPDGLIEVRKDGWASQSTACFIEEVTGFSSRIFNHSLCITVGGLETRIGDEPIQIREGKILNPLRDPTHTLIRGATSKAAGQYAEFMKYGSALCRLKTDGFSIQEANELFAKNETGGMPELLTSLHRPDFNQFGDELGKFLVYIGDTSEEKYLAYNKAMLCMAWSYGASTWGKDYEIKGSKLDEQTFKNAMKYLIMGIHRDEIFKETLRDAGDVKRDPHLKYFRSGWKRYHLKT